MKGHNKPSTISPERLAEQIGEIALDKKAEDVVIIDIREVSSIADYFVVASGSSEIHIKSITDEIVTKLKAKGMPVWHVEGGSGSRWILLDYVDVVVHIFHPESRSFYQLEKLWGDAPSRKME
jgi:ribosome-associated protein